MGLNMKKILLIILVVLSVSTIIYSATKSEDKMSKTVYDFTVTTINGEEKSLADFEGKVLLIVNTASNCGFTPQYRGLQELYNKYNKQGLEILGFPCNQFGGQEPGSDEEIKEFCDLNYSVTFPMFSKIDVNGDNAHPLYKFLKSEQSGLITDEIKWNFTKFLVDQKGKPVDRYASTTKPESIANDIEKLLN
jgi:glutathione peroxidase